MRKLAILIAVGALALGSAASSASAASTKWVDQAAGSDLDDGNTEATAYATLQFAIDNSMSGILGNPSVINVKDGIYGSAGQFNVDHCGVGAFPAAVLIEIIDFLTIQAVAGHEPVIKPVTAVEANIVSLAIENSNNLIIDNIDSDQTVAQFDNWHVCDSDDLTVRNSAFEGGEDGIDFNTGATNVLIENNTFTDINTGNGDEVLDFTDGAYSGIVIQDNAFQNNYRQITFAGGTTSAIVIQRNVMDGTTSEEAIRLIGADDITLVNNVILNSMQQGLYIDTGSSNIDVLHNTFFNNDQEDGPNGELRTNVTSADIVIKNNIVYASGTNPIFETTVLSLPGEDFNLAFNSTQIGVFMFGASTITGMDPSFVSIAPGSEDLNLTAVSPAIDAADDLGVTDDITGATRPVGLFPDMGAYEFGAGPMMIACVGFQPPMDKTVSVKKKNRVLPLKMVLLKNGVPVTDLDILDPPLVEIDFTGGDPTDPAGEDFLSAGKGDEGNKFVFSGSSWDFNLLSTNFSGTGTYMITAVSGNPADYVIDPTCTATFMIL